MLLRAGHLCLSLCHTFSATRAQVLVIARPHGSRRMLNLNQLLVLCNSWKPAIGGFKSARCRVTSFEDGGFLDDLAVLQQSHILVSRACVQQHGCGGKRTSSLVHSDRCPQRQQRNRIVTCLHAPEAIGQRGKGLAEPCMCRLQRGLLSEWCRGWRKRLLACSWVCMGRR